MEAGVEEFLRNRAQILGNSEFRGAYRSSVLIHLQFPSLLCSPNVIYLLGS